MIISKNAFRVAYFYPVLLLALASGCTPEITLDMNLSEAINESIFSKMNPDEVVFIKSVLFSSDPHTKGSLAWIEESIQKNIGLKKNAKITSNAICVIFYYPAGRLPSGYDSGMIFANVDQVQNPDSVDEFIEWVNIARLPKEKIKFPQLSCRLMFWFASEQQGTGTETLLEITEDLVLEEGRWNLLKINRSLRE